MKRSLTPLPNDPIDNAIVNFITYTRSLDFESRPDYYTLKNLIKSFLTKERLDQIFSERQKLIDEKEEVNRKEKLRLL